MSFLEDSTNKLKLCVVDAICDAFFERFASLGCLINTAHLDETAGGTELLKPLKRSSIMYHEMLLLYMTRNGVI